MDKANEEIYKKQLEQVQEICERLSLAFALTGSAVEGRALETAISSLESSRDSILELITALKFLEAFRALYGIEEENQTTQLPDNIFPIDKNQKI